MEAVLLDLVLSGAVEVNQILPWILCSGDSLPQTVASRLSEHLEAGKDSPPERPLQAAHFRETVLNTVRLVFAFPHDISDRICRVQDSKTADETAQA